MLIPAFLGHPVSVYIVSFYHFWFLQNLYFKTWQLEFQVEYNFASVKWFLKQVKKFHTPIIDDDQNNKRSGIILNSKNGLWRRCFAEWFNRIINFHNL